MLSLSLATVLLTAATAPAEFPAQDIADAASKNAATQDPADLVDEILAEYDEAMARFSKAYQAAETEAARGEIYEKHYPDTTAFALRLREVIDSAPEDPASLDAAVWILENAYGIDNRSDLLAILLEHHIDSKKLGGVCMSLVWEVSIEAEEFLRNVHEKSSNRKVVGQANFALAGVLGRRLDLHGTIATMDEETREQYSGYYGEEMMDLFTKLDAKAVAAERKKLLVLVRDEFGDIKTRSGTLGDSAGAVIFEMERLQVGMVAPDIVGPDLDGIELKLSDYRGKVVFLDFWGDW